MRYNKNIWSENMQEIELKAHVYDVETVKSKLSTFAEYKGFVERSDTYYKQNEKSLIYPLRVRKEKSDREGNREENIEKIFLTYKRKSLVKTADGSAVEKNEEKESEISSDTLLTLETFLEDNGFKVYLRKIKSVFTWKAIVKIGEKNFDVTIELCRVEPLGDFLELEILSDEKEDFEGARKALEEVLARVEIDKSEIEEKSYSQMLKNSSN